MVYLGDRLDLMGETPEKRIICEQMLCEAKITPTSANPHIRTYTF